MSRRLIFGPDSVVPTVTKKQPVMPPCMDGKIASKPCDSTSCCECWMSFSAPMGSTLSGGDINGGGSRMLLTGRFYIGIERKTLRLPELKKYYEEIENG